MSVSSNKPVTQEQRLWNNAVAKARRNFGYFWRELSWENQRATKELEFATVLFEFTEEQEGGIVAEYLWLCNVYCNGLHIYGTISSHPQHLQSFQRKQTVKVMLNEIEDWIYVLKGRAYGAYTINLERARMTPVDRNRYDLQWGYDFGDPANVECYPDLTPKEMESKKKEDTEPPKFLGVSLTAPQKKGEPTKFFGVTVGGKKEDVSVEPTIESERLRPLVNQRYDHPMALATHETVVQFYQDNPEQWTVGDERGMLPIHTHSLAGDRHIVRALLEMGVPVDLPYKDGRTAKDMAKSMQWLQVVGLLSAAERGQPLPPSKD